MRRFSLHGRTSFPTAVRACFNQSAIPEDTGLPVARECSIRQQEPQIAQVGTGWSGDDGVTQSFKQWKSVEVGQG